MASRWLALLFALIATPVLAQGPLPAPSLPLTGNEQIACVQPPPGHSGSGNKGCTASQLASISLPHIDSNAALSALPHTTYPAVWRVGFTSLGDVMPMVFVSSASPCSLNAGSGDGALQVPTSDAGCWNVVAQPDEPVSEAFGNTVGSTDESAAAQALANDMQTLALPSELLWDGQWTACFTLPAGVTLHGRNSQMSAPVVGDAGSAYVLAPPGHAGACIVQSGTGLQTGHIHDLAILGSAAAPPTPVANSIGLDINSGFLQEDENVKVYGFDTCWRLRANGGEGAHLEIHGMYASACSTHYVDDDGWREVQVFGGRLGDNGATHNLSAVDFWYLENNNAGSGPNTLLIDGQQWNPDGTHCVQAAMDIGNLTHNAAVGFGEIRLNDVHAECHVLGTTGGPTSNVSGGNAFIRTDSTVPNLVNLWLTNVNWNNTSAVDAPWFQNVLTIPSSTSVTTTGLGTPTTGAAHLWIKDSETIGCASSTRSLDMSIFQGVSDAHFSNLFNCGTVNYTSNFGKMTASFALVSGVEVMTVTALASGFGPFLHAGIAGASITAGTTIIGDSTSGGTACGGSACTGTGGTIGVSGGTTGTVTYAVSGSFGTVGSETVTQDSGNYVADQGSAMTGALTLGGYWDGQTVAGASGLLVNDLYGATPTPITDTARGFVKMSEPVQSFTPTLLCGGVACGAYTTQLGWTDRGLGGDFTVNFAITLSSLTGSGNVTIGGLPSNLVCSTQAMWNSGSESAASYGAANANLKSSINLLPQIAGTILLTQSNANSGTQSNGNLAITDANLTAAFSISGSVHCMQAN